jgi:hypothetical protein
MEIDMLVKEVTALLHDAGPEFKVSEWSGGGS